MPLIVWSWVSWLITDYGRSFFFTRLDTKVKERGAVVLAAAGATLSKSGAGQEYEKAKL